MVELEDSEEEVEREGGVGFELFVEGEEDSLVGDAGDFGTMEEAVGDDVVDLAGFSAENASEVGGLVASEGCGGGGPGVGDPTAASHASILLYSFALFRGVGRDVGGGFAGSGDADALFALMIEIHVQGRDAAVVPGLFGDREVKEDHTLGGLAGVDHRFAEKRRGGEGLDCGKGDVDVGDLVLFDGAGIEDLAVAGGEGGGEVFEEEREVELVVDTEGGEDVEVVLSLVVAHEGGL